MLASEHVDSSLFIIEKAYGCDNIVKYRIPRRHWLSYTVGPARFDEVYCEAVTTLNQYFQGGNKLRSTYKFHYPIVVEIDPSNASAPQPSLTFSAALPEGNEFSSPTDSRLSLKEWSEMSVYARPFLAHTKECVYTAEALAFAETLTTVGLTHRPQPYYWDEKVYSDLDDECRHKPFLAHTKECVYTAEALAFAETLTTVGLTHRPQPYYWVICAPDDTGSSPPPAQIWFMAT